MTWLVLGLVASFIAVLVWARVQGLLSADAKVWRWLVGIAAFGVALFGLLGRRRKTRAIAIEQVRDVIETEEAIEAKRIAVELGADEIIDQAKGEAARVLDAAQPSADLKNAAAAMNAAFGDEQ